MSPWLQLELSDPEDNSVAGVGYNRRQKAGRFIFAVVGVILVTCALYNARMGRPKQIPATFFKKVEYDSKKPQLNVAVVGGEKAGKSTLVGQILKQSGVVSSDKISNLAWLLDEEERERQTGRTLHTNFAQPVETEKYIVNFIDVPGIKLQTPQMWDAIVMADAVIYVVSAAPGNYEGDASPVGNLRMIMRFLKANGVSDFIFAVNQDGMPEKDRDGRYRYMAGELKNAMLTVWTVTKESSLNPVLIPVSALKGINVFKKSGDFEWFEGSPHRGTTAFSIKEAIDAWGAPSRDVNGALNVLVGHSLSYVKSGTVNSGGKVKLCPSGDVVTVDKLMKNNGDSLDTAAAGDIVSLSYSSAGKISSGVAFEESQTCGDKVKFFDAEVRVTNPREPTACHGESFTNNWTATIDIGLQHVPCATKILERWGGTNPNALKAGTGERTAEFGNGDAVLLRFYPYSDIYIDLQSEGVTGMNMGEAGTVKQFWFPGAPLKQFANSDGCGIVKSINAADDDGLNFDWDMCARIPGCWDFWEGRTDEAWQVEKFDKHGIPQDDDDYGDGVYCDLWLESDEYRLSFS